MREIIPELWFGNLFPAEQCVQNDERIVELLPLIKRHQNDLYASLTEPQLESLGKLEACQAELQSFATEDAFACGLRLGLRLMAEAFTASKIED